MPICKLCGNTAVLVRSHIIPDAFNRDLKGGSDGSPVELSTDPTAFPRRRPGGLYDENLVCDLCERRFWPWDDYGTDFLLNRLRREGQPLNAPTGETLAFSYSNVDYERLKLFAISLLWRASATSLNFFNRVDIGPHEDRARQMIVGATPGSPDEFSTMLVRWAARSNHERVAQGQFSPYNVKLNGVNEVKLFLGGVVLHIKVDKRPYPAPFPQIILRPNAPLYVPVREFAGSKDVLAMRPAFESVVARSRRR